MSNTFSKLRLDHLHDVMAGHVERGSAPGIVTLVQRNGEIHVDVVGKRAIDGEPMTRDTIFRIASMTKPIVAVAALSLIEECVLRLDDPVDELLPELANPRVIADIYGPIENTVPAVRAITMRDLLTFRFGHGFGFPIEPTPFNEAVWAVNPPGPPGSSEVPPPDVWLANLGALPLAHQPGEQWLYNTGSDVLGILIARAAQQPLAEVFRERIFEPLGMHDTGFVVPAETRDRFATSYLTNPDDGSLIHFDDPDGHWATPPTFPSGAGGLASTVDDFAKFGTMLLNRGTFDGERIMSRAAVDLMTTDQLTAANKQFPPLTPGFWDDHGYGFGVSVRTKRTDLQSVGTYGWAGGLGTCWDADPVENFQAIILTQASMSGPTAPPHFQDFWTCAWSAIDD